MFNYSTGGCRGQRQDLKFPAARAWGPCYLYTYYRAKILMWYMGW